MPRPCNFFRNSWYLLPTMVFAFSISHAFAIVPLAVYLFWSFSKWSRLPPGPRGLPLIGNLLDMPTSDDWLQYRRWSQELRTSCVALVWFLVLKPRIESDIIYLNVCGTSIVVLNSLESILDLLEKRSSKYSSRFAGQSFFRHSELSFSPDLGCQCSPNCA